MTLLIRKAVATDEPRCFQLLQTLGAATGNSHDPPQKQANAVFADLLRAERGQIIVAVEDSEILGMATTSYNLALRYGGEYCQLEELIVDPGARGKNIGGLLVTAIVDNAQARGCAEVGLYLLDSTAHNQPFYEKYGFQVIGSEMRQSLS